jgi:hypothetical protein
MSAPEACVCIPCRQDINCSWADKASHHCHQFQVVDTSCKCTQLKLREASDVTAGLSVDQVTLVDSASFSPGQTLILHPYHTAGLNVDQVTLVDTANGGITLPVNQNTGSNGGGGGGSSIGAIVGGVVGGVVAAILLLLCESCGCHLSADDLLIVWPVTFACHFRLCHLFAKALMTSRIMGWQPVGI